MGKKPFAPKYDTYDPNADGYGNPSQWGADFRQRLTGEQIEEALKGDTPRAVLGVGAKATWDEIKRAYRKLARENHPDIDRTPGAEERMKKINGAFDALQNEFGI